MHRLDAKLVVFDKELNGNVSCRGVTDERNKIFSKLCIRERWSLFLCVATFLQHFASVGWSTLGLSVWRICSDDDGQVERKGGGVFSLVQVHVLLR